MIFTSLESPVSLLSNGVKNVENGVFTSRDTKHFMSTPPVTGMTNVLKKSGNVDIGSDLFHPIFSPIFLHVV